MPADSLAGWPVVRAISAEEHLAFVRTQRSASFLQTPAWAAVKSEWRHESLGWCDADGSLCGAGLVLYRQVPKVKRYLAYLPEGPLIDWDRRPRSATGSTRWRRTSKEQGAFGVRIGPPVVTRRWSAAQVKEGIADPAVRRLADVEPLETDPVGTARRRRAHRPRAGGRSVPRAASRPASRSTSSRSRSPAGPRRTCSQGMNQLWRRNIKKADKSGVVVTGAPAPAQADLKAFHDLYVHTAERDHFTPRPLSYFATMLDALSAEDPDRITLWLAHHEGDLVAATIAIRVGAHTWYSYGASSTDKRDVRGSNAVQWAMIRDALAAGADVYDLRGITDTLDADDSHVGLIQFKVGTGGEAVEYAGEWDLPLNRLLYKAFDLYMGRRG